MGKKQKHLKLKLRASQTIYDPDVDSGLMQASMMMEYFVATLKLLDLNFRLFHRSWALVSLHLLCSPFLS